MSFAALTPRHDAKEIVCFEHASLLPVWQWRQSPTFMFLGITSLRIAPKVPALLCGCPFIGTSKIADAPRLKIERNDSIFFNRLFCVMTRT